MESWKVIRTAILLMLVVLITSVEASATNKLTGLSLNGRYIYHNGEYVERSIVLDKSMAWIQIDFFPPDDWPCVQITSSLKSLYSIWHSVREIDYCGGIGWRHWIIEPGCCEWYVWTVSIDPLDQTLMFYVRRGD